MTVREALSKIALFSSLDTQTLETIALFSHIKHYEKGELLFREGSQAEGFFVVLSGLVKIFKTSWEGKEQVLHIFGPFELFAEVPVFHGTDYPASAEAVEPTTVLSIPKDPFLAFLRRNGEVAIHLLAVLSARLRFFTRLIEDLSLKEVPSRLATYLLYRYETMKGNSTLTLDIPKHLLAGILGTTPESLSRAFARLKQMGCIDVMGKNIIVLQKECIERVAIEGK